MLKTEQKQTFCSLGTKFTESFKNLYDLVEHGEKKAIHEEICSLTVPPISPITARKYCNNTEKIPKSHRPYFERIMAEILFRHIEKKKLTCENFIKHVEPHQKELQKLFIEKTVA
jgi:hypothetical protein